MRCLIVCFFALALIIPTTLTAPAAPVLKDGNIVEKIMEIVELIRQISDLIKKIFTPEPDATTIAPSPADFEAIASMAIKNESVLEEIMHWLRQHNLFTPEKMAEVAELIELLKKLKDDLDALGIPIMTQKSIEM